MRQLVLFSATLALLAAAPAPARAWGKIQGDGAVTTEQRQVGAFDRVELRGFLDAEVKVGPARSVAVVIDGNLQPHVRTRVEGSTLVVDTDEDLRPSRGGGRVLVSVPALRALRTSGSGDVRVEGGEGELSLETSGSGEIRWRGKASALEASTQGSGEIHLEGEAEELVARTHGSGDVRARGLRTRRADVRTSGSGDVEVTLAGGALRARTSGSGDVTWYGEARVEEARTSGSGAVVCGR